MRTNLKWTSGFVFMISLLVLLLCLLVIHNSPTVSAAGNMVECAVESTSGFQTGTVTVNINVSPAINATTTPPLDIVLVDDGGNVRYSATTCIPPNTGQPVATHYTALRAVFGSPQNVEAGIYKACYIYGDVEKCTTSFEKEGLASDVVVPVHLQISSTTDIPTPNQYVYVIVNIAVPDGYDENSSFRAIGATLESFTPGIAILSSSAPSTSYVINPDVGTVQQKITFENILPGRIQACIDVDGVDCKNGEKEPGTDATFTFNITEDQAKSIISNSGSGSTCNIPGLGWILCPVLNIAASIADGAYDFISLNLLEVKAEIFTGGSGNESTAGAWSIMRNIANVAFVIAFLIIIFSQLTGTGVTNYGVKKLLPRIIIAAILVNLSYYICQIAVDISNIIGRSLSTMFDSVNIAAPQSGVFSGGNVWTNAVGLTIGVAAGAAIIYANLAALIPFLLSAVLALIMILFILGARQAIIILLIVISPLAFVAYLLPNTENWYKKWQKTFLAMIMLYPIIGLIFGVSKFSSAILISVANGDFLLSLVGSAIAVLPLFMVPSLLKKSLDGVGNIGATLNNLGGKMGGWAGKKVMDDTIAGQAIKYKDQKAALRRAQTQSGTYEGKNKLRRGWSALHGAANRAGWTGEFGNRRSAQGFALTDAEDAESLKNAGSLLNNLKVDNRAISNAEKIQLALGHDIKDTSGKVIVRASDVTMRRAAMQQAAPVASVDEAHALLDASRDMSAAERKTLVSSMIGSSAVKKAPWLGGKTFADIEAGTASSSKSMSGAINNGGVTAEALVGADDQALKRLNDYVLSTAADSSERKIVRDAVADIDKNPLYKGRVAEGSAQAQAIQALRSV